MASAATGADLLDAHFDNSTTAAPTESESELPDAYFYDSTTFILTESETGLPTARAMPLAAKGNLGAAAHGQAHSLLLAGAVVALAVAVVG